MHFAKSKLLNVRAFKEQIALSELTSGLPAIDPFKTVHKDILAQLTEHQNTGVSAAELVEKFTWAIDEIVRIAWQLHFPLLEEATPPDLIAVGGYGRGELQPYSDIDLLILVDGRESGSVKGFIEHFLRFLWDIGLEIGHSVRSEKDCVREAKADVTVMTTLLEARILMGDQARWLEIDEQIRHSRVWGPDKYVTAKLEEQRARHWQHQDTAFSLEPNLKDSPGGLRDLQTILWVYNRRYGTRTFKEMKEQGHLNEDEYRLLIRARNSLWKLRSGLHLLNKRHEDRLLFDAQRTLATQFGYLDTERSLAVEQLMKRYYRTAKQIVYLNEVLLSAYHVNNVSWSLLSRTKSLDDDFVLIDGAIAQKEPTVFEQKPIAMLRLFAVMQTQKITAIHPDTIRAIRANLHRVDNDFRKDPETKAIFIKMFAHEGIGLTNALARMNAYELLGAYLPPFGAIVGQMQHDLFHVYTVDGHTLMVIRNLTRLRKYPDEFPFASDVLSRLYKPERLFVGALFHDIAKGRGGDHSELGEVDAVDFCLDHGMSEYDAKFVGWLVLNHLRMSHFSQRRDINDPEVIEEFAAVVGDLEHLDALYLLTLADIRGTSPKVWNAWKGQLLLELYQSTRNALRAGTHSPFDQEEHVNDRKRAAMEKIIAQLGDTDSVRARTLSFWSTLYDDYFLRNEPFYLAWHATSLIKHSMIDIPLVVCRYSERLEANMFFIVAPSAADLLTRLTHALDQADLNIIEARMQLSRPGLALYSVNATASDPEHAQNSDYLSALETQVRATMLSTDKSKLISRSKASRALKHFPIQPVVNFNFNHPKITVMEVLAQDQPGLLHNVALILQRHKIQLISARIATFGERAEDIFFIQKIDKDPIKGDDALQALITQEVCDALER